MKKSILLLPLLLLCACSSDNETIQPVDSAKSTPMTFRVIHPGETRATDSAFEEGDQIGLYVANDSLPLEIGGNLVNNQSLMLNGGTWTATHTLYWDDGVFNAYAYYPYRSDVSSVDAMPFSVSTYQDMRKDGSTLGGYEASDLLYASAKGIKASASPIQLQFRHIMSKLKIRLVKGEDYDGDLPTTAEVYVFNTVTGATIDLSEGIATRDPKATEHTIKARKDGDYTYSAIIVPQRLENRLPLVEVVMNGVSYIFESRFAFKPGVEHLINLIINDNPEKASIEIGGEVVNW